MTDAIDMAALRRSVAALDPSGPAEGQFDLGCVAADARVGGLERGALHEVQAAPRDAGPASGFALALALRAARPGAIVWIRDDLSALEGGEPFGAGFADWGAAPERVLLVAAPRPLDALKAAGDAAACAGVGAVVIEAWDMAALDLVAGRRLALSAARSGATLLALRRAPDDRPSAARTRWLIRPGRSAAGPAFTLGRPAFDAELLRSRKGAVGRWPMEWDDDRVAFRNPDDHRAAPHPGARLAAPADRSLEAGLRRAG